MKLGVGAAIAAGSHAEKGIWALLVHDASTIKKILKIGNVILEFDNVEKFHLSLKPEDLHWLIKERHQFDWIKQ